MKYESDILKRLIDTYGVMGNPQYISEIIKEFIVQGKECFPNLFTYQSDWLAHIDEFGLNPSYTVSYTGQSIYAPNTLEKPVKSATLKGSTKYRDIDTGDILDTFDETKNLELVSVKVPVLTTTGKNLLSSSFQLGWINTSNGSVSSSTNRIATIDLIKVLPSTEYAITRGSGTRSIIAEFDDDENYLGHVGGDIFTTKSNTTKIRIFIDATTELIGHSLTVGANNKITYEPYKSNILTVNEDVTLRSNGSVYDELDLLTGKLTQRIDEDGSVLTQEIVKTVDLTILDQNGQNVKQLMAFNGGTHFITGSSVGSPLPTVSVSVETDLEETLKVCSLEGNTL